MSRYFIGPIQGLVLCPVESAECERAYVLLPTLSELLRSPGFGLRDPICLPDCPRPLDGWSLFGSTSERDVPLH